ncbi:pyruvate, water dikinase regulatory protein [Sinimarinibacterium sp. NLF-5-8]|uniref:posphoenolpyruvate synthetase regulatory kinase/phosphorylase PpsR n=1 Tax=Sinimarinibacterium sp. NLF-5-8 TaxID=2698684 RepID=UPI00137C041C|nr:pyruvate, water dikinase regulatory protein [Sinimarinibacterium sp. NLF-5-8]QHS09708.1 kinase/pyrophosphorylase [Sinimarinibacterium sp. NLF-5-8]
MTQTRPVFFVSDGTGITAETLGNSLLTQFEGFPFDKTTLPFVNTVERAKNTVDYINFVADQTGARPLVISTTVNEEVRAILRPVRALFMDLFDRFMLDIEEELNLRADHAQGRAHGVSDQRRYEERIDAMHYAMEHDDGASTRDLSRADVILIAPSRCGKTPTTMYLALQYGLFSTNFPLTEDDLEQLRIPDSLKGLESRCFGLTSDPERLAQIRSERRSGSRYASLEQCSYELRQAEQLYRRYGIPFVNSASMSIEEISTVVMQEKQLRKRVA